MSKDVLCEEKLPVDIQKMIIIQATTGIQEWFLPLFVMLPPEENVRCDFHEVFRRQRIFSWSFFWIPAGVSPRENWRAGMTTFFYPHTIP
jgi:hypothetical protein